MKSDNKYRYFGCTVRLINNKYVVIEPIRRGEPPLDERIVQEIMKGIEDGKLNDDYLMQEETNG